MRVKREYDVRVKKRLQSTEPQLEGCSTHKEKGNGVATTSPVMASCVCGDMEEGSCPCRQT